MRIPTNPNWVVCFLLFVAFVDFRVLFVNGGRGEQHRDRPHNLYFYSARLLPDGEEQRTVNLGGVTARETTALVPTPPIDLNSTENVTSAAGIRLFQVTDGRHLITAIYYADYKIKDCEYVRDRKAVRLFLDGLKPEFEAVAGLLVNNSHKNADERTKMGEVSEGGVISVKLLRHVSDLFPEARRLVDYSWIRGECRSLHAKQKEARRDAERGDEASARRKRELLIYPGTNWCGVGSSTEGFNDLGWNAAADRCCRQHDHCPYIIESFSKKYNLFNYRFHTLSHCECDERFRTCLKMVNNAPSNLVGKLFFNVVQMKCFVLKSEKSCVKKSWWGRCLKYDKQLQAHERDVLSY